MSAKHDPACSDPDCSYRAEIHMGYYVQKVEADGLRAALAREERAHGRTELSLVRSEWEVERLRELLRQAAGRFDAANMPIYADNLRRWARGHERPSTVAGGSQDVPGT